MNWFFLALVSVFALAVAELTQQYLLNSKTKIEERTSGVLTFLVQAIFTLPLIFVLGLIDEFFSVFDPPIFPYFIAVAIIGSVAMVLYLRSFKVKNISISSIFLSLSIIVSTTIGIIVLNESLNILKILGIVLILIAIISLNFKNIQLERNHYWGLVAGILFGLAYSLDKKLVLSIHPLIYIFWTFTSYSFLGTLFGLRRVITTIRKLKLSDYQSIFISGIGYFVFNICTFFSYRFGGEVGRVDAINNSQVFIIILIEYFIFKHKSGLFRKLLTALVAILGIIILGYSK